MSVQSQITRITTGVSDQAALIEQIKAALDGKAAGIVPAGTIEISENGTFDVTEYADAKVQVPVGVEPTGTIEITENGTFDVAEYADAKVQVPVGVEPTGTLEITENGTFDVTNYASAKVNVPGSGSGESASALADELTNQDSLIAKIAVILERGATTVFSAANSGGATYKSKFADNNTDLKTLLKMAREAIPLLISFTVKGSGTYQADEGMTWAEWVDSSYNTDGFTVDSEGWVYTGDDFAVVGSENAYVDAANVIIAGETYDAEPG